ncbi:hypothetical protein SAY87_015640 [Trapa incisa]|uniref:Uncharacterized protein n=1 Tax=Trapa incisa TaxID=236973 RepID=A0AAN7L8H7_9MYRT|nr:hypothetical protein SAY87_015640 [Trapa incisa]
MLKSPLSTLFGLRPIFLASSKSQSHNDHRRPRQAVAISLRRFLSNGIHQIGSSMRNPVRYVERQDYGFFTQQATMDQPAGEARQETSVVIRYTTYADLLESFYIRYSKKAKHTHQGSATAASDRKCADPEAFTLSFTVWRKRATQYSVTLTKYSEGRPKFSVVTSKTRQPIGTIERESHQWMSADHLPRSAETCGPDAPPFIHAQTTCISEHQIAPHML